MTEKTEDLIADAEKHQELVVCGNARHTNFDVGCPECEVVCDYCTCPWPCDARRLADRLSALTTPQEAKWEHGVIGGDDMLARLMDTLAYYHCRSVNPKADSPYLGYHAMSEDQREFLREKQREAAEEVLRMWHAESRPPAPQEGDAREQVLAALNAMHPRQAAPDLSYWGSKISEQMRAALTAAGVTPQGSAAAAAALCDEVIADLGDNIQTHGPDCYRWHAGCLALRVRQALGTAEFHGPVSAQDDQKLSGNSLDREKLIAEATERINGWSAENQRPSDIGMIVRLRDALAAQPVLDPEKVAEKIERTASEWDLEYDDEYDYSEEARRLARALCEAAKRGELT